MKVEPVKAWAAIDERDRMLQIFFDEWFADDFAHEGNTKYNRQIRVIPVTISPEVE